MLQSLNYFPRRAPPASLWHSIILGCRYASSKDSPKNSPIRLASALGSNVTIKQGPSWVTITPQHVSQNPRAISQKLRNEGKFRAAHSVLRNAGFPLTHNEPDLLELLLVLLNTDEFPSPRDRLHAMTQALWNAPIRKPKRAFGILLLACARAANQISDNSYAKRHIVVDTAKMAWRELVGFESGPDSRSIALMYQICGDCKELELAQTICRGVNDPILDGSSSLKSVSSEETLAAYILCLGKCGRSNEAERLFFSAPHRKLRNSNLVLSALFRAHIASNKISKAESLISIHGSEFLTVECCNAFVKQCSSLRMFESALDFLSRMERHHLTGFPAPVPRTYNLLLRGLSKVAAVADEFGMEQALAIVERMQEQGLVPTNDTHNLLLRSFVFRDRIDEAVRLYKKTPKPDRITYTHIMQGAERAGDLGLAEDVFEDLKSSGEGPSYGFCKAYLLVLARENGISEAFGRASDLVTTFQDVLVFGDVGREEAVRMALIYACGKVGDLESAFQALEIPLGANGEDRGALAPLYVATVLMQACLDCGSHGRALEVFESLKLAGLQPNFEVYESLIHGFCTYVRDQSIKSRKEHFEDAKDEENHLDYDIADDLFHEDHEKVWKDKKQRAAGQKDLSNEVFNITLRLLREMHVSQSARVVRKASYVYNSLIVASACVEDFELAMEIFRRMTQHNDTRLLYVSSRGAKTRSQKTEMYSSVRWPGLEGCNDLPPATVNTYNSMIMAAWRCGRPKEGLLIYERMLTDRETEPNGATMNLLADIGLESEVSPDILHVILKALDQSRLPQRVAKKRVLLRQKILAFRWGGQGG